MRTKPVIRAGLFAALIAAAGLLGASGAVAAEEAPGIVAVENVNAPHVPAPVSQEQLAEIGSTQTPEEIKAIVESSSYENRVQVLLDFNTNETTAAVVLDRSTPAIAPASITACPLQGIVKGISKHGSANVGWCGSGEWTGSRPNLNQYTSNIATNTLVGTSNLNWNTCPGYAVCSITPTITMGYLSFN